MAPSVVLAASAGSVAATSTFEESLLHANQPGDDLSREVTRAANAPQVRLGFDAAQLDVKSLITHRQPIQEAPQAYELLMSKEKYSTMGVVFTYSS